MLDYQTDDKFSLTIDKRECVPVGDGCLKFLSLARGAFNVTSLLVVLVRSILKRCDLSTILRCT